MLSQINKLIQHKDHACLSITFPTHSFSAMRWLNRGVINNNFEKARKLLLSSADLDPQNKKMLMDELDNQYRQLGQKKLNKGLGIFVSPTIAESVCFPFGVQERVAIGESFETRDLLYYSEYASSYYVLMLGKTRINLFRSKGDDLTEVVDRNFPMLYINEAEFTRPDGNSFGGNLKSKSSLTRENMIEFFREADQELNSYLKDFNLLIVCGTRDETGLFRQVTAHERLFAGTVAIQNNAPFSQDTISRFHEMIYKTKHANQKSVLKQLDEDYSHHKVADGLENVWKAAHEGNGLLLAVEKDYARKGYFTKFDHDHLHTVPPTGEYDTVADAVEDVIDTVRKKSGNIMFVENEELRKFDHIAMLLRAKS